MDFTILLMNNYAPLSGFHNNGISLRRIDMTGDTDTPWTEHRCHKAIP